MTQSDPGQLNTFVSDFVDGAIVCLLDNRYIRVNGKPILLVNGAGVLEDSRRFSELLREALLRCGAGEVVLAACGTGATTHSVPPGFDVQVELPPHGIGGHQLGDRFCERLEKRGGALQDYHRAFSESVSQIRPGFARYRSAMLEWDNSVIAGESARIFHGFAEITYQRWLTELLVCAREDCGPFDPVVFVNAWNDWPHGCYLEPDQRRGRRLLEATSRAKSDAKRRLAQPPRRLKTSS